jgi:hypothetical protein
MEELLRSPAAAIGFVVVVLVVSGVGTTIWFSRTRRTRAASTRLAAQHGLRYFPEHPFGLERLAMPLFQEADTVDFSNLVIGDWDGLPFTAAEVKWTKERGGAAADVAEAVFGVEKWVEEREYAFIVVELDLRLRMPWVVVTPHGLLSKAKSAVGLGGIRFEHGGEFSSSYQVRAEDHRFAHQLFSPGLMNHLMQRRQVPWPCPRCGRTHIVPSPERLRYELSGSRLLVAMPLVKANTILPNVSPLFAAAQGFLAMVPMQVWSQVGAPAGGGRG